jgi:hypothetical protein
MRGSNVSIVKSARFGPFDPRRRWADCKWRDVFVRCFLLPGMDGTSYKTEKFASRGNTLADGIATGLQREPGQVQGNNGTSGYGVSGQATPLRNCNMVS